MTANGGTLVDTAELSRLRLAALILADLDRNQNGRHRGDSDSGDPSGRSQGNPLLPPGTQIGYTLSGDPIVVPDGGLYDPTRWLP